MTALARTMAKVGLLKRQKKLAGGILELELSSGLFGMMGKGKGFVKVMDGFTV